MTTAGSFDGPRRPADGRPCRKHYASDSCGRCRGSWDTSSARNSCERMSETSLLCYFCLRGVLRTSVQSETDPNAVQFVTRAWAIDRIVRAVVDGLDDLQTTRASLSPQSRESISGQRGRGARSARSTPSPQKHQYSPILTLSDCRFPI
jgi:hypothetical protein